jgi:outer membrane scaffolding protein for murein synthesis (MipA/OmpV family)
MGLRVALIALLLAIPGALAAELSIGAGIGVRPEYEGSSDYELVPVPAGNARWSMKALKPSFLALCWLCIDFNRSIHTAP